MGGVIGFDLPALLTAAEARGISRALMLEFATRAEGPMAEALNAQANQTPNRDPTDG